LVIAPTVSATDYSAMESYTKNLLLDPAYNLRITNADVSINTQQVTINCITQLSVQDTDAPFKEVGTFLSGVLGVYMAIVNSAPEVGDLLIVMKNFNEPVATFSCPKSWVTDVDPANSDASLVLMAKVLETMKS
jgi:hypothetical protein